MSTLNDHPVVSREEWLVARKELLRKEKELTRLRDQLAAERRALPWVKIEKEYTFDTPEGKRSLADLFDGRSQLIVQHFMFSPLWKEGCVGCSLMADSIQGDLIHLHHHDVTFVAIARAPLERIEAFKKRMGWKMPWVSSFASDFNYDFKVSFTKEQFAQGPVDYNYTLTDKAMEEEHGISVFYKNDAGEVFHTYSSFGRGNEDYMSVYVHFDATPKGRAENGPTFALPDWARHHDRYGDSEFDFMAVFKPIADEEKEGGCCCSH